MGGKTIQFQTREFLYINTGCLKWGYKKGLFKEDAGKQISYEKVMKLFNLETHEGPVYQKVLVDVRDDADSEWLGPRELLAIRNSEKIFYAWNGSGVSGWNQARLHQPKKTCPECGQEVEG